MLFRRNRAVVGGFGEKYKPEAIFGQGNSFRSQRLFGEFDLDDWPVSQTKDRFDWDAELESLFIDGVHTRIRELERKADSLRVRNPKPVQHTDGESTNNKADLKSETTSKEDSESNEVVKEPQSTNSGEGIPRSNQMYRSGEGKESTPSMESCPATEQQSKSDEAYIQTHFEANSFTSEYKVNYLGDEYTFTINLKPLSTDALFSKSTNKNNIEVVATNPIDGQTSPDIKIQMSMNTFANKGDKIFDSHFGSLSIGISCYELGFGLDACEIDKEYYDNALKRLKEYDFEKLSRLF